ncbi:RluA family pseudouridine synthase [Bdellovibrio sp. HCB337]|uniref:RluA family pseudouridine synthase n=1 Tax=Bdellovibrio sp. HCB337 TaxID=3394358 RepID=UPI0039A6E555
MPTTTSALSAKIKILFEDDILIVIDKPAGLPTQATLDKTRPHVYGILQTQLQAEHPGSYLALHHRLDKDTSGVLLFCKDKSYNQKISDMFKQHQFEKIYLALTEPGKAKKSWQVKNYLTEKPAPRSRRMSLHSVRSGGNLAITDFQLLETHKKGFLIEARPRTGRMHQIRVHLAEAGLPILGDDLYNTPQGAAKAPRMMLHAYRLVFPHPRTHESITVTSEPPKDFQNTLGKLD